MTEEDDHMRTALDEELESRLSGHDAPPPPGGLRDRCLPAEDDTRTKPVFSWKELALMHASRRIPHAARIAAVLVMASFLAWGWSHWADGRVASAEILQGALATLENAPAVHITTEVYTGPGTMVLDRWEILSVAGLGFRSDHSDHIEVYNEKTKKRYSYYPNESVVRVTEQQETSIGYEFLRRGRQDENVHYMIVQAREGSLSFRDEAVMVDGRAIRRLSCDDERGYAVIVELDPAVGRVLRTESWTHVVEGSAPQPQRVVTRFDYPDLEEIDPSLFRFEADSETEMSVATPSQASLNQCLTNLRDLVGSLWIYEGKHPEGLPSDLEGVIRGWEGFRESMLHCPLVRPDGTLQYSCTLKALGVNSVVNLPWDSVVFECDRHEDVIVQSYGGSHAMTVPKTGE